MKGKKVFKLNKRFYIYFIVAVVLIALIFIVTVINSGKGHVSLFYSPEENAAIVLTNGESHGDTVPGKSISCVRYNSDSTSSAVLMSDGAAYSLFAVNNKKVEKIADNCTSNVVHSYRGRNSVYIASDGNLYIGKNRIDESVDSFAVSSDCSAVIFSKKVDNIDKLYLYKGGKTSLVNENYTPLAVSDDGKYLYVLSGDNSLCILGSDGTMKSKLCSAVQTDAIWFSDDLLSVVFSDGAYTYISNEGRSRVRLVPGNVSPVFHESEAIRLNSSGTAFICNDDELTDIFYSCFNEDGTQTVFFVNDDYSRIDIANSVKKFVVTGKESMSYLDSMGRIYRYDGASSELIVSGANDFTATSNNRYIYYITTAHELYSVKGSNTQLVASNAEKMYMTASDDLLVIMTNKDLYSISGTKRSDVIDSQVSFCVREGDVVFYTADYNAETGTYDLYSSKDGKKFRLTAENVIKSIG